MVKRTCYEPPPPPLSHSLTLSLTQSLSLSLTHSLTHSLFLSLSHPLTHSLSLSLYSLSHLPGTVETIAILLPSLPPPLLLPPSPPLPLLNSDWSCLAYSASLNTWKLGRSSERERERERECVCVCVCVSVCACVRERERERERECVCVCVCMCERKRVCVCMRKRELVKKLLPLSKPHHLHFSLSSDRQKKRQAIDTLSHRGAGTRNIGSLKPPVNVGYERTL